ncbi:MAG: hypothetical protein US25_C0035G0008 [Candidatus Moranbacteria bacterium GW2011_GWE1_36_7]|nr:MAG: hypothetical protein US25_C0035G0008 [Candidatus Moranbacteria bacterium GW2011_GWE1_36_7]
MTKKFVHEVSKALTAKRIEEIKEQILAPKPKTTRYLNDLAKAPNITTIPFFSYLRYKKS